jgi:glycosyltransferase involved in cell wall biosynthesis
MSLLNFITAIPLNVRGGSGCYIGVRTLVGAIRQLGVEVVMVTPTLFTPAYTVTRILFNETLRWHHFAGDAAIGADADGYAVAKKKSPHIACIKGVLGDAVRFERGATKASLALQAALEAKHARRADLVITVSRYCAERIQELYGVKDVSIVPELIDLDRWRGLFYANNAAPDPHKFTILTVCRFYPRKRVDVLVRAAAMLRRSIPGLQIRIVGNGLEYARLRSLCNGLDLGSIVHWLGDVSMASLTAEYNRSDVFCLPSVQEGFGIVLLEAMAAGSPIVAVRSAAVPKVVRNGILVEPDSPKALVEAIEQFYRDPNLRESLGKAGQRDAQQFESLRIARQFLGQLARVAPAVKDLCAHAG